MRPLFAGNWKMNGMVRQLGEIEAINALVKSAPPFANVLICPPATLIARGANDCRPYHHRRAAMPDLSLLSVIGAFALMQMSSTFGFRQKREDLQLILFWTLLIVIMLAGTIWVMASLAMRTALPAQP